MVGAVFLVFFLQKGSFHPNADASMMSPTRTVHVTVTSIAGGLGKEMGPMTTTMA